MNPSSWQDLPDQPPGQPRTTSEPPTMVLERSAVADPPPAFPPRSDSLWWRVGSAVALVAVLGAIAWLISDRAGDATEPQAADPAPTVPTTLPDEPGGSRFDSAAPSQDSEDGLVDPFERRDGSSFFFGTDELPPEIREFLERNGLRTPFPEDFRPGERPNLEEFFGQRPFEDGFGFSFDGALPPEFVELLERLPDLLFGPDEASRADAEALITELLQDPDLAPELRRFVERLADRLDITVES